MFEEDISRDYVDKCAYHLNTLGEDIIDEICYFALEFCKDVMKNYDEIDFLVFCF